MCTFPGEVEHRLERLITETATDQFVVTVGIRCVQTDGNGVNQSFEIRCNVAAIDKIAETVGIDTDRLVVSFFKIAGNFQKHIDTFCRFAKTAEDEFIKRSHVKVGEIGDNLIIFRFTGKPQGIGFSHMIHCLSQTESTGTWTFIRKIDIKIVVYFIKNSHI